MKAHLRELALKIISGIAEARELEAASIDDVRAIKTDQDGPHFREMDYAAKAVEDDGEGRTFEWIASTEHVDSMGDIIRVAGWDTKRLSVGRCPLLLNHDPAPAPAGLLKKAKRARTDDGVKALAIVGRFHEDDLYGDSDCAKILAGHRKLVARGELVGSSVGFMPGAARWPDDDEREKEGMPKYGVIFEEQELLELSITCIPANAHANRKSLSKMREAMDSMVKAGEITKDVADALLEQASAGSDAFEARRARIQRELVPVGDMPWLRGSKPAETKAEPAPAQVPSIEDVTRAVSAAVQREVSRVIREAAAPLEASMTALVERVEDAVTHLEASDASNSKRGEVREHAPDGDARAAMSTGASRDNPTPSNPSRLSAAEALVRVSTRLNAAKDSPDGGQADGQPEGPRR